MLSLIIQITVVSIIFIFVLHYLINFFKDNLTVPKTKDLVNAPNKKYENMYNVISSSSSFSPASNYNDYDLLPEPKESMKDELKSFLKKQLQVASSSTEISTLSADTPSFADY
jgi:hypothetical protein